MKKYRIKHYRKVSRLADNFAKREYICGVEERGALSKGFYHGYIAGVKACSRKLRSYHLFKEFEIKREEAEVLGEAKIIKL